MDPAIDKLERSDVFKDESRVAYALAMYKNLSKPNSGPLINAITGKKYTIKNFSEYLVDFCKVEPIDVGIALRLLKEVSH